MNDMIANIIIDKGIAGKRSNHIAWPTSMYNKYESGKVCMKYFN